jgi:aminopeptidase N
MLRRQLGDSLFWKGVQAYYNRYAGKNAITGDLCKVMEDISGQELKGFFNQWLFKAGHPKLAIRWKYNAGKKEVNITVIQQQLEIFNFPIDLQIGKDLTKRLLIKDRETQINVAATKKPAFLLADPQVNLLFEGEIIETK